MAHPEEITVTSAITAIPGLEVGRQYFCQAQGPLKVYMSVGDTEPGSVDAPGFEVGLSHYFRLAAGESAWVWVRRADREAALVYTEAV